MKNFILTFLFSAFTLFLSAQIVTDDVSLNKGSKLEVTNNNRTEIYFGGSPAYTYRTLTQNKNWYSPDLTYQLEEKPTWAWDFNAGVRVPLRTHLKFEIGAGYSQNKESFDYTATDSVFRYINTYRHIAFPLKLAYTYGNNISFYGGVGVIPKAFLSMKHSETQLDLNGREKTVNTKEQNKYNQILMDAVVSVGTQIKLGKNYGFYALLEGKRQLNNNYVKQHPYIRKPYSLGFNIGFEIYLD